MMYVKFICTPAFYSKHMRDQVGLKLSIEPGLTYVLCENIPDLRSLLPYVQSSKKSDPSQQLRVVFHPSTYCQADMKFVESTQTEIKTPSSSEKGVMGMSDKVDELCVISDKIFNQTSLPVSSLVALPSSETGSQTIPEPFIKSEIDTGEAMIVLPVVTEHRNESQNTQVLSSPQFADNGSYITKQPSSVEHDKLKKVLSLNQIKLVSDCVTEQNKNTYRACLTSSNMLECNSKQNIKKRSKSEYQLCREKSKSNDKMIGMVNYHVQNTGICMNKMNGNVPEEIKLQLKSKILNRRQTEGKGAIEFPKELKRRQVCHIQPLCKKLCHLTDDKIKSAAKTLSESNLASLRNKLKRDEHRFVGNDSDSLRKNKVLLNALIQHLKVKKSPDMQQETAKDFTMSDTDSDIAHTNMPPLNTPINCQNCAVNGTTKDYCINSSDTAENNQTSFHGDIEISNEYNNDSHIADEEEASVDNVDSNDSANHFVIIKNEIDIQVDESMDISDTNEASELTIESGAHKTRENANSICSDSNNGSCVSESERYKDIVVSPLDIVKVTSDNTDTKEKEGNDDSDVEFIEPESPVLIDLTD